MTQKRSYLHKGFWSKDGLASRNTNMIFLFLYMMYPDATYSDLGKNKQKIPKTIAARLCKVNPDVWCEKPIDEMVSAIRQQLAWGLTPQKHVKVGMIGVYVRNQTAAKEMKKYAKLIKKY